MQIYPEHAAEDALEAYLPKVRRSSQAIYTLILLGLTAALISLPFIKVDVSVQARGFTRSYAEKTEIRSLMSGKITKMNFLENKDVHQGDDLFLIGTADLDAKLNAIGFQTEENQLFIEDLTKLEMLKRGSLLNKIQLATPLYTQQLNAFQSLLQENIHHQNKIKKELDADRWMYKEKVLAKRELDAKEYELTSLKAAFQSMAERQFAQWQAEYNKYTFDQRQLKAEKNQQNIQKTFYTIKAPISGNIQQAAGKYIGSYVQAGETLGVISPDSSLLVECFLNPGDVGLLKPGMKTNLQIDAFNYNEWGFVPAKIVEISKDFTVTENQPLFKVKCQLLQKTIKLKTGTAVPLKKGLSLSARFVVANRSLYQLLFDKVDDWLNPSA